MALSESVLSGKIKTEIESFLTIQDSDQLQDFCDAIAKSVVDHVNESAEVTGTVTSGTGAGGSVVGTVL